MSFSHHLTFGMLDASVLDHGITPTLLEEIHQEADDSLLKDSIFDEFGDLHQWVVQCLDVFWGSSTTETGEHTFHANLHDSNPTEPDWKSLRLYSDWQSEQVIQITYKVTSRFGGTVPQHDYLKKYFKSRNPVFNIPRRNQPVATDTVFSDTPAINDRSTMVQFLLEKIHWCVLPMESKVRNNSSTHSMATSRPEVLWIPCGGKYEISKKVANLLRSLFIKQYESEPYHQHKNKAEQHFGVVKRYINTLINLTGVPAHCWLLCMVYVCALLNVAASPALMASPPFKLLLDKSLTSVNFYIFLLGTCLLQDYYQICY